jgi:hypothetical protein
MKNTGFLLGLSKRWPPLSASPSIDLSSGEGRCDGEANGALKTSFGVENHWNRPSQPRQFPCLLVLDRVAPWRLDAQASKSLVHIGHPLKSVKSPLFVQTICARRLTTYPRAIRLKPGGSSDEINIQNMLSRPAWYPLSARILLMTSAKLFYRQALRF